MLQAMIDIGSNTIRMAVYEIKDGHATQVMKQKHAVGLAAYVKDGRMRAKGIEKAAEAVCEYRDFLAGLGITAVEAFTTAALRNAENSIEAVALLEELTGLPIRVISGEDEAAFDFVGAIHDLEWDRGVILDIGGASAQAVLYRERRVEKKASLPLGSLSLRTQYVRGLLPTTAEASAIREEAADAAGILLEVFGAPEMAVTACGIGGTFKSALALYRLLYDRPEDDVRMETSRFDAMLGRYISDAPPAEHDTVLLMRAAPDRIHTLLPGLILADELLHALGCDAVEYSDSGVREGYLYSEILGHKLP